MAADGIHPALTATDYKQPIAVALSESDMLALNTQFGMDKTIFGTEREIANTLTAREDRGISIHNQEGTAIGVIVNERDQ